MKRKYDITSRKGGSEDIKIIAQKLRDVFLKSTALPRSQQKMLIGIYLRYLIYSKDIAVHTESELQVFIYKFAKEVFDEYDIRTSSFSQTRPAQTGVSESVECTSKISQKTLPKHFNHKPKSHHYTQSQIVQHLLTPYENLTVSADNHNRVKDKLKHRLNNYLSTSEFVLDKVINKAAHRLIAAMEPKTSLGSRFMNRLRSILFFPSINPAEKNLLRIKKYHEKGLLCRDCKEMYRQEIMKYVSE